MIGVYAVLKIQEGKGAEFEKYAEEAIAQVLEKEPGCLLYRLFKIKDDEYAFIETYEDQAALEAHGASDHFKANGRNFAKVLAGRPEVAYGPVIAG